MARVERAQSLYTPGGAGAQGGRGGGGITSQNNTKSVIVSMADSTLPSVTHSGDLIVMILRLCGLTLEPFFNVFFFFLHCYFVFIFCLYFYLCSVCRAGKHVPIHLCAVLSDVLYSEEQGNQPPVAEKDGRPLSSRRPSFRAAPRVTGSFLIQEL